jgi:hypothetical protein
MEHKAHLIDVYVNPVSVAGLTSLAEYWSTSRYAPAHKVIQHCTEVVKVVKVGLGNFPAQSDCMFTQTGSPSTALTQCTIRRPYP